MALSFEDIPIEGAPQKRPVISFSDIPIETAQAAPVNFEDIPVAGEEKPSSYFDRLKSNLGEAAYGAAASSSDLLRGVGKMVPALPFEASRRQKTATQEQLKQWADQARQRAAELGIPADEKTIGDIALTTATRMGLELPKFALFAGAAPIAGFGAMSGLEAAGQDASPAEIAQATAAGATTGAVFKGAGFLAKPQRVLAQAGGLGAVTAGSGGSPEEIVESAVSGGVLGLLGHAGGKRFRDLRPIAKAKFEEIPVARASEVVPQSTIPPEVSPQPALTPPVSARPAPGRAETPILATKASQIAPDRVAEWQDLRSQIATAEAGKRIFSQQEGQGGTMEVTGSGSTFPIKNLAPKKTQLQVIDKALAGKPLTPLQSQIFEKMQGHLEKQKADWLTRQENNPVPMTTAELNLKVGDEVRIPGDKLRVTKVTDEGITLKDGITKTVDPVFDQIEVVGGEHGVKRAPERGTTIATEGDLAQKAGLNDSQLMSLISDTAKAENLRTLADNVSRGTLTIEDAALKVKEMAAQPAMLTEGLPAIESKNAELLRQQKAQDAAQFARKELPPQAPSLEGESVGSNLFAKQADLTTLLKDAFGVLKEETGAVGKLTKEQIATRQRGIEARKEILRRAQALAESTGGTITQALERIGINPQQIAALTTPDNQAYMFPPANVKAGPWTRLRETVQDRMIRVKNLEKTEGLSKPGITPYEAEILYHGRSGSRVEEVVDAARAIDKDIVSTSKKFGGNDLTREVNTYLQAKHAPERNAVHGENAAGMTTARAAEEVSRIESAPSGKEVIRIAKKISDLNRKTLDTLLEGEVITRETYDTLRSEYPNHVPLQRILESVEDVGSFLSSKGMDVKSTGIMRAKGSDLPVADILSNVTANLESAIVRAEKNRVGLATLKFARENPQLGIFEVSKPQAAGLSFQGKPIFDKMTDPQTLVVRENGKPVYVKIKDPHLAAAYRGINVEHLPMVMRVIGTVTRLYSGLATRFNPEFFLPNKIRDLQEAAAFMASQPEIGFKGAAKAVIKDPISVKAVTDYIRGKDTPGAKLYQQMIEDGGTTGGMALSTREQVALDMDAIRKVNRSNPRKAVKATLEAVDKINQIFEDSTRLSAYKQALDAGLSRDKAAIIAKESSINFNRKGTGGPIINSIYMFSNASIQGSVKLLRAMSNPKVAAALVSSVGISAFTVNQWNDAQDPDWRDKVSPYDRASSLSVIVPSSDGVTYVTIPISWGIKPIKVMADLAYDAATGQLKNKKEAASAAVGAIIEGYNPVGGTDILSALTPTIADIPVEIGRNKAWYGNKIKPDFDPYAPASSQYFESLKKTETGKAAIAGTEALSKFGVEISPADVVYAYKQIIGGTGRFITKVADTTIALAKGEAPLPKDVPFLSRFLKSRTQEEVDTSLLGKWKAEMKAKKSKARVNYKRAVESGDKDSAKQFFKDYKDAGGVRINTKPKPTGPLSGLTAREKRLYQKHLSNED